MACVYRNGNKESPVDFGPDYVKIMVIGEANCGKSAFIRECVRNNYPKEHTSINGIRVHPCEFEVGHEQKNVAFYEIPSHPGFLIEQRRAHYLNANIFVFMYAIDDPTSLEMLTTRWIPETIAIINSKFLPVAVVGNKKDLRSNPEVIERLALNNQVPVAPEQAKGLFGPYQDTVEIEISALNSEDVLQAFIKICDHTVTYGTL